MLAYPDGRVFEFLVAGTERQEVLEVDALGSGLIRRGVELRKIRSRRSAIPTLSAAYWRTTVFSQSPGSLRSRATFASARESGAGRGSGRSSTDARPLHKLGTRRCTDGPPMPMDLWER